MLGHCEECIELGLQGYRLEPFRAETNFEMGRLFHSINEYDRAVRQFDLAISLDPHVAYYYGKRGWAYFRMGLFPEAEADFKKALQIDETSAIVSWQYFVFLISLNRIDEAEEIKLIIDSFFNLYSEGLNAIMDAARGEKERAQSYKVISYHRLMVCLLLKMDSEALDILEARIGKDLFAWDSLCFYKTFDHDPLFDRIRGSERFKALIEEQRPRYLDYKQRFLDGR